MNLVRGVISVFLSVLLVLLIAGWRWAGDQPSPKLEGARFALALCGVAAVTALGILWTQRESVPN